MRALGMVVATLVLGGGSQPNGSPTGKLSAVAAGGGAVRALTDARSSQPALSPDGRTLAYVADQIRLIEVEGRDGRAVGTARGAQPRWSPNRRTLAYTAWDTTACVPPATHCAVTDVWTVNVDGTEERKVLGLAVHPAWSPDGRLLLFREFVGPAEAGFPTGALKIARPDGSHVRTLSGKVVETDGQFDPPSWSPNGRWIAFEATVTATRHRLFLVRPDGSGLHPLTAGSFPVWSPNGKVIAYERSEPATRRHPYRIDLWVIPAAGGRARRVSTGAECPSWSPDGRRIAFLTYGGAFAHLGVVRSDGRGRKLLATATDCDNGLSDFPSPPVWSSDGRSIYFVG